MLDAKLIFCEDLDLGDTPASQASTDLIDCGAQETALGEEEHLRLQVWASEAFNDSHTSDDSTYNIELQDCATADGTYYAIAETIPLLAGAIPVGKVWDIGLPTTHKRFLRLYFTYATGTGDIDAGKINAFIIAR